jgi:hypothetical protein
MRYSALKNIGPIASAPLVLLLQCCVPLMDEPVFGCNSHKDCPGGQLCVETYFVSNTCAPYEEIRCSGDTDCPTDAICSCVDLDSDNTCNRETLHCYPWEEK